MFWGVTLENGKKYESVVEQAYHLSMAAIEPSKNAEPVSVYVKTDTVEGEYLLCSLDGQHTRQVQLDLLFVEGAKVSFYIKGNGKVHLTGYLAPDEDDGFEFEDEEEESDEEASDEEISDETASPVAQIDRKRAATVASNVPVKRAKTQESPAQKANGKASLNGKAPVKVQQDSDEDEEDDDYDESDEGAASDDKELEKMLAGLRKAKSASVGAGDMSIDDDDEEDDEEDDDDEDEEEAEQKILEAKKKMKEDFKKPPAKPQQQQQVQKPQQQNQQQKYKPQHGQQGGHHQGGHQGTPKNPGFNKNKGSFSGNKFSPQQGGGKSPNFNKGGGNTPFQKNKARPQSNPGQRFSGGKKH